MKNSKTMARVAAEERQKGRKAISLGDPNNTIIFVKKEKDNEEAKNDFMGRLKGKSILSIEKKKEEEEEPGFGFE